MREPGEALHHQVLLPQRDGLDGSKPPQQERDKNAGGSGEGAAGELHERTQLRLLRRG